MDVGAADALFIAMNEFVTDDGDVYGGMATEAARMPPMKPFVDALNVHAAHVDDSHCWSAGGAAASAARRGAHDDVTHEGINNSFFLHHGDDTFAQQGIVTAEEVMSHHHRGATYDLSTFR